MDGRSHCKGSCSEASATKQGLSPLAFNLGMSHSGVKIKSSLEEHCSQPDGHKLYLFLWSLQESQVQSFQSHLTLKNSRDGHP